MPRKRRDTPKSKGEGRDVSGDDLLAGPTSLARSVTVWCARNRINPSERDQGVWVRWADDVLAERGLLPERPRSLTLGDLARNTGEAKARSVYIRKLAECIESATPGSAEWFAGRILQAGYEDRSLPSYADGPADHLAVTVGELLTEAETQRLLPDAVDGRNRRSDSRNALQGARDVRWGDSRIEDVVRLARELWENDPEEFGPRCRKARADAVSRRLEMDFGHVYNILQRRRA